MLSVRIHSITALVGGLLITAPLDSHAQNSAQMAAQQAARQQTLERQDQEIRQVQSLLGIDPTAIKTIGLWPGRVVPCKLPKRERPYECQRLLEGPALVLSKLTGEFIVARGDQALARGERSWWSYWTGALLALAAGEILYQVGGDSLTSDNDLVVTIYRSAPPASVQLLTPPKACLPACENNLLCEDGQCVEPCRPTCGESQYCATDRHCYWIRSGRKTADPVINH